MSAAIERLPVEVFDLIAKHLHLQAYQSLRLTSRQLHLLTFSTFSKQYFSELTTTLGSSSLNRLVNIASHACLGRLVQLLDIKILNHRDYKLLTKISRVGIHPPPKRFPRVSGVKPTQIDEECTLYDDICGRKYPKCIVDCLVQALQGFDNLTAIRFRAHHTEPFGWKSNAMPEGDQVFRSRCFQAVLDAILKSQIQLEEFSMAKAKRTTTLSKSINLPYPSLQLPLDSLPAARQCFANLESLTLSAMTAYNGDARIPGWENGLSILAACAPNLKSLTMSLDRQSSISHYSAAVIRSLSLSCRLMQLESFHLVNCSLHEAHLAAFIVAHNDTLQQIVLSDMRMLTGTWPSLWASFRTLNRLTSLRLASLEGTKSPILFRRRDKEKLKVSLDVEKSGRTMCGLLDDLIAACNSETEFSTMGQGLEQHHDS